MSLCFSCNIPYGQDLFMFSHAVARQGVFVIYLPSCQNVTNSGGWDETGSYLFYTVCCKDCLFLNSPKIILLLNPSVLALHKEEPVLWDFLEITSSGIHSLVINYLATWPKICCTLNVYTLKVPQGLHNHLAHTIWSASVAWPCLQNTFMMTVGSSIL